jgi:hypothetical protein
MAARLFRIGGKSEAEQNTAMWTQRFSSSIPIRLTIVYTIIWSCVLMGLLFLWRTTLERAERVNASSLAAADWDTLKGYLKIERGKANWYADYDDPVERTVVSRLRRTFLMIDSEGQFLERSDAAGNLERLNPEILNAAFRTVQQAQKPVSIKITDRNGNPFLLFGGRLLDESHQQQYYALIARPVDEMPPVSFLGNSFLLVFLAVGISFPINALMVRHCLGMLSKPHF